MNLPKVYTIFTYFSEEYIKILLLQSVAFLPVASQASSKPEYLLTARFLLRRLSMKKYLFFKKRFLSASFQRK